MPIENDGLYLTLTKMCVCMENLKTIRLFQEVLLIKKNPEILLAMRASLAGLQ